MPPLKESHYNIKSTKDFINKTQNEKVPNGYPMVSFDAKSLFPNVPLDRTIRLVFKRIFEKHEISTNIAKQEIEKMLMLCTENVSLIFYEGDYKQSDVVEMRFPLGPVFANIFIVELENIIVPNLWEYLSF